MQIKEITFVALILCIGCRSTPEPIPVPSLDTSFAQRGEYLVKSLAACGFCHGENSTPSDPLSGGRRQLDAYGEATAPNLTPDATGLPDWDVNKLVKAIRHSIREEGAGFSPYFHRGFEWLSDTDAISIAAYLKTLQPVENSVDRREIGFLTRNTVGIFNATAKDIPGFVPEISKKEELKYGEYLVDHVSRCGRCHNAPGGLWEKEGYLAGGMDVTVNDKVKVSPELTSSGEFGLGSWEESDIVKYLRTGNTPDLREVDTSFCPITFYRMASTEDLQAIARYLKSLPTS